MASINDLDLPADAPKETLDTEALPEQMGKALPALYPGTYKFKIPSNIASAWTSFMMNERDKKGELVYEEVDGKKVVKQSARVAVQFDEEHPLEVVDCADKTKVGQAYYGRVSNAERNRARKNEARFEVPDMIYLLQALGFRGKIANGANRQFIEELNKKAGHTFVADVEWSAYSNENSVRYIRPIVGTEVDHEQSIEDPSGKFGDGKRWYMKNIPKDAEGKFCETWSRDTGEVDLSGLHIFEALRAFPNLTRFRPAAPVQEKVG
jgi:hypothetical protein